MGSGESTQRTQDVQYNTPSPSTSFASCCSSPTSRKIAGSEKCIKSPALSIASAVPKASPYYFPNYCLPMGDFLGLDRMRHHEDVLDSLINPSDNLMMHFVSHEWLGFRHPDPDGVQLKAMQTIFKVFLEGQAKQLFQDGFDAFLKGVSATTGAALRMFEGNLTPRDVWDEEVLPVHIERGCVWLDYHSIPQVRKCSFKAAIHSIAHYVERCDYFWICAPPAVHVDLKLRRDFATWQGRGWCRLEEMANLLGRALKMPLVIARHEPHIQTYGYLDGLQRLFGHPERSVANGTFSCCQCNHKREGIDGSMHAIPCDKDSLRTVMVNLFAARFDSTDGTYGAAGRNLLRLAAPTILAGFADHDESLFKRWVAPSKDLGEFLCRTGFLDIDAVDELGWTPLVWAAASMELGVVKELLTERPQMMHTLPHQNTAILGPCVHIPHSCFKQLLAMDSRWRQPVMLNQASDAGYTMVDRMAKLGFHENLRTLLELRANTEPRRVKDNCTPLLSAASEGYAKCCEVLLEFGADITARDHLNQTALHLAAVPETLLGNPGCRGKCEVLQVLLDSRASINAKNACGMTALQVAQCHNFEKGIALLKGLIEL
mmetsp:Transcript_3645/g.7979  ORF Transcript_3645/g.7979 Transcript_3645/m.7979 type:complete len:601 (+) Transcript_3645:72-1874(+)